MPHFVLTFPYCLLLSPLPSTTRLQPAHASAWSIRLPICRYGWAKGIKPTAAGLPVPLSLIDCLTAVPQQHVSPEMLPAEPGEFCLGPLSHLATWSVSQAERITGACSAPSSIGNLVSPQPSIRRPWTLSDIEIPACKIRAHCGL